jgi:predicted ABC-type transport system involved in lysophospholipase L1 biosynthesis ATPase subunit
MVNELIVELVAERGLGAVVVTHNSRLAAMLGRTFELIDGRLAPARA